MKDIWNFIQFGIAAVGGWLGYFLGGWDGFFRITSYNVCYTKLLRLDLFRNTLALPFSDRKKLQMH